MKKYKMLLTICETIFILIILFILFYSIFDFINNGNSYSNPFSFGKGTRIKGFAGIKEEIYTMFLLFSYLIWPIYILLIIMIIYLKIKIKKFERKNTK